MGWAAGFRAGTAMAGDWIDTYNASKDRRVTREVEEELQGLRDQKQAAVRRYDDEYFPQEYGLPSYLQDGSLAEGEPPVGLGAQPPVPLRNNPPVPEVAPNPNQVPPNSIPPSIRRSDTAARPPRPDRPTGLSDIDASRMRVQRFREEGRVGLADQEQERLDKLEQRDYRRDRDRIADERFEVREAREAAQFAMETQRLGYELENLEEAAELRRLTQQFAGMSPHDAMDTPEYQNLAPHQRAAIASTMAQMSKAEMDSAQAYVEGKVDSWKTWDQLLTGVNEDNQITEGTYFKEGRTPDGRLTLQMVNDADDSAVGPVRTFETQSQKEQWLREQVTDPATAASLYEANYQNYQNRLTEQAQLVREGRLSATESIYRDVLPEFNDPESPMGRLEGAERARAIRAALVLYEPFFEPVPDANGNPTYPDLDRFAQGRPNPNWETTGEGEDAQPRPSAIERLRERRQADDQGFGTSTYGLTPPEPEEPEGPTGYQIPLENFATGRRAPGKPQGLGTPQAATTRPHTPSERVMNALIMAESGGDPNAVSPAGAQGLAQIMPATGRDPGFGIAPISDPFDPVENRRLARDYLGAMLNRYGGDLEAALVAYNAGPRNADRFVAAGNDYSVLPKRSETEPYVNKIMGALQ